MLTESQLGMALRRRIEDLERGRWAEHDQLFYARTPSRKEIDFVGARLDPVAVEGKYVESDRWARAAATVNASHWSGILATRNVLDMSAEGTGAWAVPAGLLAYAIDT
ncbi:MAG: hypothetical protein WD271_12470 [Acidimicrobiia bacterium]